MKRVPQLDGIRGIAILLVLLWHYVGVQIMDKSGALTVLNMALGFSWSGVDLFFVLSGFLIAGILIDHRDASNYFRVFYLRRVCRILPLYLLLLAVFVCFSGTAIASEERFRWLFAKPFPLWAYLTFTQNVFMSFRGWFGANFVGITWSLAIEEQFYLLMPALVCFLPRKTRWYVFLPGILLAPILRLVLPGFHAFVLTPWRADSLLCGVCLAMLVRSPRAWAFVEKRKRFLLLLFVGLLAGAVLIPWRPGGPLTHTWLAALYSVFILIALLNPDGRMGRLLKRQLLVWLGIWSYGIYMFHEPVFGLLSGFVRGQAPALNTIADVGVVGLALVLTILIAALSHKFFEQPILQLGHRFRYINTPPSPQITLTDAPTPVEGVLQSPAPEPI